MKQSETVLRLRNIGVCYHQPSVLFAREQTHRALSGINVGVQSGERVAIIGRSGSGKSTLARCLAGLMNPTEGELWFIEGHPSPRVQLIFQDSPTALNPYWTVRDLLLEPLHFAKSSMVHQELHAMLSSIGLNENMLKRRPAQLSGGQRQRVALGRALFVPQLKILLLDEPFSGLDPEARGALEDLVAKSQHERQFATIYFSHDLARIRRLVDRVLVLDDGRLVDEAATNEFFRGRTHPASRALLDAMLLPEPA